MARIGGSGLGMVRHVRSMVPSPPIVIMRSVLIFSRGNAVAVLLRCFANFGSRKSVISFVSRCSISFLANSSAFLRSVRETIPTTLNSLRYPPDSLNVS